MAITRLISTALILLTIGVSSSGLAAQKGTKAEKTKKERTKKISRSLEKGNLHYKELGFNAAIKAYESSSDMSLIEKERTANAYRMYNDFEKAAQVYSEIVNQSDSPIIRLHYAQVLHSLGKVDQASQYYEAYAAETKESDGWHSTVSSFARRITDVNRFQKNDVTIINESAINSENLEFSPAIYDDGVIFVSTQRPDKHGSIGTDEWTGEPFMNLRYAKLDQTGRLSNPSLFSAEITSKFHEGPVSVSVDEEVIFFTRNDLVGGKRRNGKDGTMRLELYSAEKSIKGWSTATPLNINTLDYDECHPAISKDGQTLYFSSNRPGGYGGMDLYKSELSDGVWSKPKNLGSDINTSGNEVFPFLDNENVLYFATNGRDGLGGLDLFQSMNTANKWTTPMNLGTPFNSSKDDFGLVFNNDGTLGYLTSARDSGRGKDDIYSFELKNPLLLTEDLDICLQESERGLPLSKVLIEVISSSTDEDLNERGQTNNSGLFGVSINPSSDYEIRASKDGYENDVMKITGKDLIRTKGNPSCILLEKIKPVCASVGVSVIDENEKAPIANITVKVRNITKGTTENLKADMDGNLDLGCLPHNCQYALQGIDAEGVFIESDMIEFTIPKNPTASINKVISLRRKPLPPAAPIVYENQRTIKLGDVIVLDHVYYDFNAYTLPAEALVELNGWLDILKYYSSMKVQLSAHTDSRSSSKYNLKLSTNRAKSAANYLISKGIDGSRIVYKGFGESLLRNQCGDGVKCSEEEHEYNRRTEVVILEFNEGPIEVIYDDKGPQRIDRSTENR